MRWWYRALLSSWVSGRNYCRKSGEKTKSSKPPHQTFASTVPRCVKIYAQLRSNTIVPQQFGFFGGLQIYTDKAIKQIDDNIIMKLTPTVSVGILSLLNGGGAFSSPPPRTTMALVPILDAPTPLRIAKDMHLTADILGRLLLNDTPQQ